MCKTTSARKIRGLLVSAICLLLLSTSALYAEGRPVTRKVKPEYPPLALKMKVEGTVTLRVSVASNGSVENATVVSGPILLKAAAAECVRQWQFERSSSESSETVAVSFKLE